MPKAPRLPRKAKELLTAYDQKILEALQQLIDKEEERHGAEMQRLKELLEYQKLKLQRKREGRQMKAAGANTNGGGAGLYPGMKIKEALLAYLHNLHEPVEFDKLLEDFRNAKVDLGQTDRHSRNIKITLNNNKDLFRCKDNTVQLIRRPVPVLAS